jgi:hypothetical protein
MSEIDPDKPGQLVHDRFNDETIEWQPKRHGQDWQQRGHRDWGDGLVDWDGLLLDGRMERPQVKTQDGEHVIDDDFYDDFPERRWQG